ncbi:hypothetical protein AAG570_010829 [Ranatra chinensis]|uniref:Serpin domain-containing protein n=1 Tax=Ranatra chinensis TaxID=642074 RepID=A0ABD0YJ48_9HEMI
MNRIFFQNSAKGEQGGQANYVFSPLGYSTILAILAEGARGDTRNQLVTALHLPEDTFAVRNTYKKLLTSMKERGVNKPEFKNWFYVYKNYSVENGYKEILAENYLTQVRHIENDMDSDSTDEPEQQMANKEKGESEINNPKKETSSNSSEEKLKNSSPTEVILSVEPSQSEKKNDEADMAAKVKKLALHSNMREKRGVFRFSFGKVLSATTDAKSKEILTALSANRLCTIVKSETEKNPKAKMIIFNGLYFRGNWSNPFIEEEGSFYTAMGEKKQVPTIRSTSDYYVTRLPHLDSSAIELPYQGERYSLLIMLPNDKEGLPKLTSALSGQSFAKIDKQLSKRPVEVFLPKFKFYTISHPKEALIKSGVRDIFDESADLSGISGGKGLYLDDLVQLVTLEVDDGSSKTNFITC